MFEWKTNRKCWKVYFRFTTLNMDHVFVSGASESAISDMQAYMDMLNPDIGSDMPKKNEIPADAASKPPPPPTYPPPPPPQCPPMPPPPPSYPAPQPPKEPSSAEFLKVKSNLRHVESNTGKKKVRKEEVRSCLTSKYLFVSQVSELCSSRGKAHSWLFFLFYFLLDHCWCLSSKTFHCAEIALWFVCSLKTSRQTV